MKYVWMMQGTVMHTVVSPGMAKIVISQSFFSNRLVSLKIGLAGEYFSALRVEFENGKDYQQIDWKSFSVEKTNFLHIFGEFLTTEKKKSTYSCWVYCRNHWLIRRIVPLWGLK